MSTELTEHSLLAWSKQPNTLGLSAPSAGSGYPRTFEATGSGHASGYTIVSSTLKTYASDDRDFVGYMVEVVNNSNGYGDENGAHELRKVVAYDYDSGAMTIEALPWQTVSGDTFKLWKRNIGYLVEDTGGSQTVVSDTDRSEAGDFWNGLANRGGPYMLAVKADSITDETQKLISDSLSAGDITCANFGASTAIGDLFEIWEWPRIESGLPGNFDPEGVERAAMVGQLGHLQGVTGLRRGDVSPVCPFVGPGSGSVGDKTHWDTPLGAVTSVTAASADEAVGADSTTTSVNVDAAVTAGSMWLTEAGDVCVALDAADPFEPSPTLRTAPASGTTLYSLRTYEPATATQYALALMQYEGLGVKSEAWGCVPGFQFEATPADGLKATFPIMVGDAYTVTEDETNTAISRSFNALPPTIAARAVHSIRVNLDGTELEVHRAGGDLAPNIVKKTNTSTANTTDGFEVRGYTFTLTMRIFLDTDAKAVIKKARMKKKSRLLLQVNEVGGDPGVFAVWANQAEIKEVPRSDEEGGLVQDITCQVTLDPTSSLSRFIIGIG